MAEVKNHTDFSCNVNACRNVDHCLRFDLRLYKDLMIIFNKGSFYTHVKDWEHTWLAGSRHEALASTSTF